MWPTLNYTPADSTLESAVARLAEHLEHVPAHLLALSEAEWQAKDPRKWSRKELLGHLVDSALNNLKRFTEAQFGPEPYVFASYRQNELVLANAYQNLPAEHLLTLWQALNRQILHVVSTLPPDKQQRKVMVKGSDGPPHTLTWLVQDYVGHMEHHFRTLL
jgi:uncharacterized damage-inducible protein DinB